MTPERAAIVRWLRPRAPELADAIAAGEHSPALSRKPPRADRATHYPCGHERSAENTVRVGRENGVRCKACRRAIQQRSAERCGG